MAFARDVYTVNNAAGETDFNVNFEYLQKSHVKVSVNGIATTDFSWLNDGQLQLTNTAAFGAIIVITRETSPAARLVDYQTGSVLSEEILDTDSLQGFFLAQEAVDVKELTMAKNASDQFEAGGRKIENLADPVNNLDAANKQWTLSATAGFVNQAETFRDEARNFRNATDTYATNALDAKNDALTYRNQAETHKDDAESARDIALTYSQTAQGYIASANIPQTLTGKAGEFLQVKQAEDGYELVASVAAPSFFGFKNSADGKTINLTYGRDDYNVADYDTWTMAENVDFEVRNNNLTVVL
jgi:hypothetical protein